MTKMRAILLACSCLLLMAQTSPPATRPGGSNTQVQYNNSGTFGGDAGLTYNAATDTLTVGSCIGCAAGVANPTGTIGLTAVNGAASTALRSDGAPALSQAIVPTWTGAHVFQSTMRATTLAGTAANPNFQITSASPNFGLFENDVTANNGLWIQRPVAEQLRFSACTDAGTCNDWGLIDRTSNTIDSIALTATAITLTGTVTTSADITSGNHVIASAAAPRFTLNETDAAADTRLWRMGTSAGSLVWGTRNDADNAGNDFFTVGRTGTTVGTLAFASTALTWNGNTLFTTANDGAGSGLDADLLDGSSSAAFAQIAATNVFSGGNTFIASLAVNGGMTKAHCSATVPDGSNNNYDIFSACGTAEAIVRLDSAAGSTLTGIVLPSNQYVTVINVGTTNIQFNSQDANSTATNRIINIGNLAQCGMGTSDMVVLWKDPVTDRVRVFPYVGTVCGA